MFALVNFYNLIVDPNHYGGSLLQLDFCLCLLRGKKLIRVIIEALGIVAAPLPSAPHAAQLGIWIMDHGTEPGPEQNPLGRNAPVCSRRLDYPCQPA